ncbi:MAG: helix-turn-helix domain-containing protein [Glycomyces artemisiae]|uniref:Helix-turn-helix domain-containing protein n=1 Tax=Glycomyces artemisiae TaxID=1076443 RepID=A0A850CA24_9ACTN|nr:helix-turn-helix domain-containing protein [Glycomyces artemisiae]
MGTPETSPSVVDRTPQQRARELARWLNRWRERVMYSQGINKSEAAALTGLGRPTNHRILTSDLSKGAPKPETIERIAKAWGADPHEGFVIMGWTPGAATATHDVPPVMPVEVRRILALLAAPTEIVSRARKRRLLLRLDSVFREDAAEALATGQPTLDDVEALPQVASTMDDLAKPTG